MRPDLEVTVLGDTLDDLSLMQLGNTHVMGPVQATELERIANSYGLDGLFVSATQPLFGHPLLTAAFGSSCRLAYFDWSNGHLEASEGDLPLDPNLSLQAIVAKLERWMPN